MARAVGIPIPLKGMNTVDPFTQDLGYARQLTDFALYQGRLSCRPGLESVILTAGTALNWYDYSAAPGYGILKAAPGNIVNLTTAAVLGNIGGACQANATTCKHVSIELLFGCQAPRSPAGAAFTAWTFTTAAITATAITCGCSWKGRLYVSDGTSIEYSNLGAIGASALNGGVPISYNMAGQSVVRMLTLTGSSQANILTDSLFAIFGSGGRVLIYSGNDPTDWVQIGQWDMPAPISSLGFIELDGDIFISTTKYAYWARDLLMGGAIYAYDNSPSKPIENLWSGLGWNSSYLSNLVSHSYYLSQVEEVPLDAVVIQCSDQDTPAGDLSKIRQASTCCLIYFRKYKAWSLWFMDLPLLGAAYAPVIKYNDVYYTHNGFGGIHKYTYDLTPTNGVSPTWLTPYFSPFAGRNQRLLGVRPFYQSDDGVITAGGIADFSDFLSPYGFLPTPESNLSPVEPGVWSKATVTIPANSYEQYHPYIGVGVDGAGVSAFCRFTSILASSGLDKQIYQMIGYFEDGGDLY